VCSVPNPSLPAEHVCVECLIGKQNKPTLFKVTEPSSVPYRAPSACAKRAAYLDPPPVILVPESIAAQAAYQLRYENTGYYSWVGSGPKCFQVLGLSSPEPATESHVVNRGTLVAPCRLKAQRKRVTRVGSRLGRRDCPQDPRNAVVVPSPRNSWPRP
jgi:hypothetical protein